MHHHRPQHVRQGIPSDIQADERSHRRRQQRIPQIVPPDPSVGVAQGLQRADLQAFLVDHAPQRGHHDQRRHRERHHREHVGHAPEHFGVAPRDRDVPVRRRRDDQRARHGFLQRGLRRVCVRPGFQLYQRVRVWQRRHRSVGQHDESVVLRVRCKFLAGDRILRRQHRAPDHKTHPLSRHRHGHGIPGFQAVCRGKLLFHHAAFRVPGSQQAALPQIRPVDVEVALINLQGHLDVIAQLFHLHRQRGAGPDLRHVLRVRDPLQVLP